MLFFKLVNIANTDTNTDDNQLILYGFGCMCIKITETF